MTTNDPCMKKHSIINVILWSLIKTANIKLVFLWKNAIAARDLKHRRRRGMTTTRSNPDYLNTTAHASLVVHWHTVEDTIKDVKTIGLLSSSEWLEVVRQTWCGALQRSVSYGALRTSVWKQVNRRRCMMRLFMQQQQLQRTQILLSLFAQKK